MNREDAKHFLWSISQYPDEIDTILEQMGRFPYSKEQIEKLKKKTDEMEANLDLVETIVSGITDVRLRTILRRRSLFNETWGEIAKNLGLSSKTVMIYHDQALDIFIGEWNHLKLERGKHYAKQ